VPFAEAYPIINSRSSASSLSPELMGGALMPLKAAKAMALAKAPGLVCQWALLPFYSIAAASSDAGFANCHAALLLLPLL